MINGLGVLGWGVGGIEAEAAMLGQPVSMLLPEVIGFRLTGKLKEGVTATDLVLTVTQMLRKKGVVGKFVEFFGPGLSNMTLADRATIGNMAPEYGATCGFFPVDGETIRYLTMSGRDGEPHRAGRGLCQGAGHVARHRLGRSGVHRPARARPRRGRAVDGRPEASRGPRRAGRHCRPASPRRWRPNTRRPPKSTSAMPSKATDYDLGHGDVVIAAITSCTNTSNPSVLIGAGLLARNANRLGLKQKPWVKTSLAPGCQVVAEYLEKSGLQKELDQIGFNLVGFGCTTCIGNSGPLPAPISKTINDKGLIAAAVLSGNRNFEGRVSPDVQANYLASPPLVVAHALAGTVTKDLTTEPLGEGRDGKPVYLKDIWPTLGRDPASSSRRTSPASCSPANMPTSSRATRTGRTVQAPEGQTYAWDDNSTYVQNPPYFAGMTDELRQDRRHQGRARARPVRRQDHHRPHLAGRFDQGGVAGRQIPDRPWRRRRRLQPVRHAARQS